MKKQAAQLNKAGADIKKATTQSAPSSKASETPAAAPSIKATETPVVAPSIKATETPATEAGASSVKKVGASNKMTEARAIEGGAAIQKLQQQLPQLQVDAKAIREYSNAHDGEEYKQLAAALDYLVQKISAIPSNK